MSVRYEETENERRIRDFMMEHFLNTGSDCTRVLMLTSQLMDLVRDIVPGLTANETNRILQYMGFTNCPVDGDVLWELYESTPPIERWR